MRKKTKTIIGVGFLLFSGEKLLAVEELESKPEYHKKAGMISFPLETFDPKKDISLSDTIYRLLKEELGIPGKDVIIYTIYQKTFKIIPNRSDVIIYYGAGIFLGDPGQEFIPEDDDIRVIGWKTPLELMEANFIRIEVLPILTHFKTQGGPEIMVNLAKQEIEI